MCVPLRKGTNPLLSWSTWSVPPSPVPIIHLISQTAASSKAIAATPALSTHRSLDLSEGKGTTKDFQSELKAWWIFQNTGKKSIKNTCDVMLMTHWYFGSFGPIPIRFLFLICIFKKQLLVNGDNKFVNSDLWLCNLKAIWNVPC